MIDIREPASPAFAGCFADTATGIFGTGYTHDAVCIVYNGPDFMYQSNYKSGLRILDIANRTHPREVGFFDTEPGEGGAELLGSWSNYPFFASGIVAVTSMYEGVFFLRGPSGPGR